MIQYLIPTPGCAVRLDVESDASIAAKDCVASLSADFAAWTGRPVPGTELPRITLRLHGTPFSQKDVPAHRHLFRTKMCEVQGLGPSRVNVYDDHSAACLDARNSRHLVATLYSPDTDLLYEIAYNACLALVGELLDTQGLHRVHALGVSVHGKNALCILGERSGKSTLAMALKQAYPEVKFFSDETPLLSKHQMFPYPNRLALLPEAKELLAMKDENTGRAFRRKKFPLKYLYSWKPSEIAAAGKIDVLLVDGGRTALQPEFTACSSMRGFSALTHSMVVGLGVAQMAEYLLRVNPSQLRRLGAIGLSRGKTALAIARAVPVYVFHRSPDPAANAQSLRQFLL